MSFVATNFQFFFNSEFAVKLLVFLEQKLQSIEFCYTNKNFKFLLCSISCRYMIQFITFFPFEIFHFSFDWIVSEIFTQKCAPLNRIFQNEYWITVRLLNRNLSSNCVTVKTYWSIHCQNNGFYAIIVIKFRNGKGTN